MTYSKIALLSLAVLPGCVSFSGDIYNHAVNYNLAVEQAQNELLLLNVVRAMKQRPMYFTAISLVRGSFQASAESGFGVPFGGDATDTYSAQPKGAVSTSPSFDVAVLDSEKFTRGIMTPVCPETFAYYWDQGWPLT